MNRLDDIFRNGLEDAEGRLPEGDWQDFEAKLDRRAQGPWSRKFLWLLAPVAAVAACVALVVAPSHTQKPSFDVVESADQVVADVVQTTPDLTEPSVEEILETVADASAEDMNDSPDVEDAVGVVEDSGSDEECSLPEEAEKTEVGATNSEIVNDGTTVPLTFDGMAKPVQVKKGLSRGTKRGVVLASFAAPLVAAVRTVPMGGASYGPMDGEVSPEGPFQGDIPCEIIDELKGKEKNLFPISLGLTFRLPLRGRWSFVSGVDFTCYGKIGDYTYSGIRLDRSCYVGVPLRFDFQIAEAGKWDFYLGAGPKFSWCIREVTKVENLEDPAPVTGKFPVSPSLIAVAGAQYDINDRIGFYFEPTFYTMSEFNKGASRGLSLGMGVRINIR